jgi:hypothetical protein
MAESKVRSQSKEKALDAKIAEISIRNKALEERQKVNYVYLNNLSF